MCRLRRGCRYFRDSKIKSSVNYRMIYTSGVVSLIIQVIIGIIDYLAINIEINSKDEMLKDLLKVELFVQVVEFIFYLWLIYYFNKGWH